MVGFRPPLRSVFYSIRRAGRQRDFPVLYWLRARCAVGNVSPQSSSCSGWCDYRDRSLPVPCSPTCSPHASFRFVQPLPMAPGATRCSPNSWGCFLAGPQKAKGRKPAALGNSLPFSLCCKCRQMCPRATAESAYRRMARDRLEPLEAICSALRQECRRRSAYPANGYFVRCSRCAGFRRAAGRRGTIRMSGSSFPRADFFPR